MRRSICLLLSIACIVPLLVGCESSNVELLEAIRRNDVDAVRTLLEAGATLEPASGIHDVNKPLAFAAAYGNLEIVELLVASGADLNGRVAYGDVPLIKADEHDNDDIIVYLIKQGADVNAANYFGVSPFIGMCGQGNLEHVELALKHGADVNSSFEARVGEGKGKQNFSPIQAAAFYGQADVVEMLLANGADSHAQTVDGHTPLELAEAKGHQEIAKLLREQRSE